MQGNLKADSVHILYLFLFTVFERHIVEFACAQCLKNCYKTTNLLIQMVFGICIQYTKELKGLLKMSGRVSRTPHVGIKKTEKYEIS
jgi:hypothetical protein